VRNIVARNLGIQLTIYQQQISDEIIFRVLCGGLQEIFLLWARQSGKTETFVITAIALCIFVPRYLERKFNIGIIAPARAEQTIAVTRDRLHEYSQRLKHWLKITTGIDFLLGKGLRTQDFIFLHSNGVRAGVRCHSAQPKAHVKGYTEQLQYYEQPEDLDDQKIKTDIFPFGAGSETGCLRIFGGTPSLEIHCHYFYEGIMNAPEKEPPYFVDWKYAGQHKTGYLEFVTAEAVKLGEDSEEFRTQFNIEWVLPRNKLVDREHLLTLAYEPGKIQLNRDNLRGAGIDVAKDVDRSVLSIGERQGEELIFTKWFEWEGTDYETQASEMARILHDECVMVAKIGSRGVGEPVFDMLRHRLAELGAKCALGEIKESSDENDRLFKIYEREIKHRRLRYIADGSKEQKRFFTEHVDAERIVKGNKITVEAPKRRGAHEDYVDSGAFLVDALLDTSSFRDLPVLTRSR